MEQLSYIVFCSVIKTKLPTAGFNPGISHTGHTLPAFSVIKATYITVPNTHTETFNTIGTGTIETMSLTFHMSALQYQQKIPRIFFTVLYNLK